MHFINLQVNTFNDQPTKLSSHRGSSIIKIQDNESAFKQSQQPSESKFIEKEKSSRRKSLTSKTKQINEDISTKKDVNVNDNKTLSISKEQFVFLI